MTCIRVQHWPTLKPASSFHGADCAGRRWQPAAPQRRGSGHPWGRRGRRRCAHHARQPPRHLSSPALGGRGGCRRDAPSCARPRTLRQQRQGSLAAAPAACRAQGADRRRGQRGSRAALVGGCQAAARAAAAAALSFRVWLGADGPAAAQAEQASKQQREGACWESGAMAGALASKPRLAS